MLNFDLDQLQLKVKSSFDGEIVCVIGKKILVKKTPESAVWPERPYLLTSVSDQGEGNSFHYCFYSSEYDLTSEEARNLVSRHAKSLIF